MPGPERRSLRLREFDYTAAGPYFVTVCTAGRTRFLATVVEDETRLTPYGELVERCWLAISSHFSGVELDCFVVMPDHIQGILWLSRAGHAPPLPVVVGSFKSAASRLAKRPLWQRSFHDRVIRNEAELQAFRKYIADNPLQWALDRENPNRVTR